MQVIQTLFRRVFRVSPQPQAQRVMREAQGRWQTSTADMPKVTSTRSKAASGTLQLLPGPWQQLELVTKAASRTWWCESCQCTLHCTCQRC